MRCPAYMARVISAAMRHVKALWQAVRVWPKSRLPSLTRRTVCLLAAFLLVLLAAALSLPGDQQSLPRDAVRYGEIHDYIP